MVLEVADISSGEELLTAPPPKQGDDVLPQSLVAPTSSLTATSTPPFPVDVESRDAPPEVCTSTSMRMYADELTAADVSNAEALLGFSPTNEHRDKPICGAYLENSTSSDVKQDVSSTSGVPSTEEREAAADNNEGNETVAVMAKNEEIKNEAAKDSTSTDVMMKETAVVVEKTIEQETFATDLVEEREKPVEEVSVQNEEGELVEAEEVTQEAAAQVTEFITEQVFLETRPDSIEASSSSKTDLLDVMTEQNAAEPETAEVETSLTRKSKGKKKSANFLPKTMLSRISQASSVTILGVVKSFNNTLSSLSKPSVPKASMRKMAKLPKIEKLPSVSKLSSSVVTGSSLISKRLSSVHVSQRSLPRLPKKLRKKTSVGKKSKTSENIISPQEIEDLETATPKTSINSTWLETESENKTLSETKIAKVEAPAAVAALPDTDAVNDVSDTALEVSASVEEKPKQRNYFEELLDKFDSLCAPICKSNINQAKTMQSPKSTSEQPNDNPQLAITTNATENSFLDGVKSLCSIATERSFFGEEKPAVQELGKLDQVIVRAREEPDQLEIAAMMAKKALDEDTGAEGNMGETKGVKSMFRIFSPAVSSVIAASDVKKVTGQSLRRITNKKHVGQVPSNEVVEPLVHNPPESQSLDEVQTIFLTNSCVASTGLNEMADKEDPTAEPAGESSPDDWGLLRLRQRSRAPKEGNPKGRPFADAEALLGRSRSSI